MIDHYARNFKIKTRFFFLLVGLIMCAAGCSHDDIPIRVRDIWNAYSQAIRRGNVAELESLLAPESRPYCEIAEREKIVFNEGAFQLLKATKTANFIELQVLQDLKGQQTGRFFYLVQRDNRLLIQYPFILFAANWPVLISSHFRFHVEPTVNFVTVEPEAISAIIDTIPYETFIQHLDTLTGGSLTSKIDYYLCSNTATAARLLGERGALWGRFGSCIITNKRYDFAEIAALALSKQTGKFDFLKGGLIGYGEFERATLDTVPNTHRNIQFTVARYLPVTPDTFAMILGLSPGPESPSRRYKTKQFFIETLFVRKLIERSDSRTFGILFQQSRDAKTFQDALQKLYRMTCDSVLGEINSSYIGLNVGEENTHQRR